MYKGDNPIVLKLREKEAQIGSKVKNFGPMLVLAGCEDPRIRDSFAKMGVRNILVSYWYLRKQLKKKSLDDIRADFSRFPYVYLDSGGFTLLMKSVDGKDAGISIQGYTEEYYTFLEMTKDVWNMAAEVDVVDVTREGKERNGLSREWMEEQRERLVDYGVPICPVFQAYPKEFEMARDDWKWFDKYSAISLGSIMSMGNRKHPQFRIYREKVIKECVKRGIVMHGLGMTDTLSLSRGTYFSADSTSWTSGARFGATHIFQNGRIRVYDKDYKDVRKRYKNHFVECGLNWDDIQKEKNDAINMMNALAWKEYADFLNFNLKNSYWLSEAEMSEAREAKKEKFKAFQTMGLAAAEGGSMNEDYNEHIDGILENPKEDYVETEEKYDEDNLVVKDSEGNILPDLPRGFKTTGSGLMSEDARLAEVLFCDTCYISAQCPGYTEGKRCKFKFVTQSNDGASIMNMLQTLLTIQADRVMRTALFEKSMGGVIDKNLSGEIKLMLDMMTTSKMLGETKETIKIEATGKQGTGMLRDLFLGGK